MLTFHLTELEQQRAAKFIDSLEPVETGAIGGRITYSFTPTTIGMCVFISDCITKREENITDYDSW